MGIPSYFAYIIKQYPYIIKKYNSKILNVNNFYLDCNSVIYDIYHKLNIDEITSSITLTIIENVICKIESYIKQIQPTDTVFITFDGVAPLSKLEQQRTRRYKSWYQTQVKKKLSLDNKTDIWSTASITPGTKFMDTLDTMITQYFNNNFAIKYNIKKIIVSGSNIFGEGEHKIFEYIRRNPLLHNDTNTFIYGLDSDLIMLSIHHINICPNIYLFRETPNFIQSIDSSLEPNSNYYLDIPELTNAILLYMNNDKNIYIDNRNNKIYDYIFLCFFLGNDFLPHFPALNIRNGGIDKLLNTYREIIKENEFLTDGINISWKNVYKLVDSLSRMEDNYMIEEHKLREKKAKYFIKLETVDDKLKYFDSLPIYKRDIEKFINPVKPYWQSRYYNELLNVEVTNDIKNICVNYLQGLEWTFKYYTIGCPDWRWCYKYNYPPLLQDLRLYIPVFNTEFIQSNCSLPVTQIVQLCYVLPRMSLNLIPKRLYNKLITEHNDWYHSNCNFIWAYCRYFWECHVELPEIDITELEKFIDNNKNLLIE
jgi:5'-3' exonuclease